MNEATAPTQEFTTTGGVTVVLKTFITGFENRRLQDMYLDAPADMAHSVKLHRVTDEALSIVVVSINGKSENIRDEILALNNDDTQEIIKKVNEITEGKKKAVSNQET